MDDDVRLAKRTLRGRIREHRLFTPPEERERRATALTGHLVELCHQLGAKSVASYESTQSEPGTGPFHEFASSHGITAIVPITRDDGMLDWAIWHGQGEGAASVDLASADHASVDLASVDLVLVPAASVDRTGVRLGWGKGYYDRALEMLRSTAQSPVKPSPPVYAVIFDEELVDSLPRERHDQLVDGVVTPSGTTTFTT
jgi:5-formyltetrahydrofolate cyclo-ligase